MANVSKLPDNLQQKRDELREQENVGSAEDSENTENTESTESTENTEPNVSDNKDNAEQVTITREEFNQLQNASDRVKASEGRAEGLKLDLEAVQSRLTDLEKSSKGSPESTSSENREPSGLPTAEYSEDELEEYGDSVAFIEKVATNKAAEIINKLLPEIESKIKEAENQANVAANTANQTRTSGFTERVRSKVPEFEDYVNNSNWQAFLEAKAPMTNDTFAELIAKNVENENLNGMVEIFNAFKERYKLGNNAGKNYTSSEPSGTTETPATDDGKKVLKFSDRKALHKRYISKEISYDDYKKQKDQFEQAEKEGRIEYDT